MATEEVRGLVYIHHDVTDYTVEVLDTIIRDVEREVSHQDQEDFDTALPSALICLQHTKEQIKRWLEENQSYLCDEYGNRLADD